jgi:hypothetical protein
VLCLASDVSPRRSDEGYEKVNCRRSCAQRLGHCLGDGSVLRIQETDARFKAGRDVGTPPPPPNLSVDFRRWDPSWIPGFPFGRLASDKTCGVRACESQSKRGLYATCWTPERPPQQSPTPSLVKSTPVKKGKNVKKESKQEVKPEIKVRAALHSYASW